MKLVVHINITLESSEEVREWFERVLLRMFTSSGLEFSNRSHPHWLKLPSKLERRKPKSALSTLHYVMYKVDKVDLLRKPHKNPNYIRELVLIWTLKLSPYASCKRDNRSRTGLKFFLSNPITVLTRYELLKESWVSLKLLL